MSLSDETMKKIAGWTGAFKKSEEELVALMQQHMQELQALHPGKEQSWYEGRARFLVYRSLKRTSRSPSVPVYCAFFGFGEKRDIWANRVRTALQMWKEPAKRDLAVQKKLVAPDGTPLDTRGRRITGPTWIRNAVGFGYPEGKSPKLIFLNLSGKQADLTPPLLTPVVARLNVREEQDYKYICSSSTLTEWTAAEIEDIPGGIDWAVEILNEAPEELKSTCADLMDWHKKYSVDQQRIVIVEADVMDIADTPTSVGNYAMFIEDETIYDAEEDSILTWISSEQNEMRDWGPGSRIYVLARTTMGSGWDPETRQPDPKKMRIILNALALVCIPEFRIPREETDVVEEAF